LNLGLKIDAMTRRDGLTKKPVSPVRSHLQIVKKEPAGYFDFVKYLF
jgi:hypothetical protein